MASSRLSFRSKCSDPNCIPMLGTNHHRDPRKLPSELAKVAGDKYSYADLDDFSDLIARTVQGAPETSKVERRGVIAAGGLS